MDEVEELFRQYEEINTVHKAIRPQNVVFQTEVTDQENSQLSDYRRNIQRNLQGPPRGNTNRGRGRGYRGRGMARSSQRPQQNRNLACTKTKMNGTTCGYMPFWNCYLHSNYDQATRAKMDRTNAGSIKTLMEANTVTDAGNQSNISIHDVAPADHPVWQNYQNEINLLYDEEIVEIPALIQTLSNGQELPNQFYAHTNPFACPRIHVMVANTHDGKPIRFHRCVALPDSGCQYPCMDEWLAQKLNLTIIPNNPNELSKMIGASGHTMNIKGKTFIIVEFCGHKTMCEASIVEGLKDKRQLFLGWRQMVDLQILPTTYPAPLSFDKSIYPKPTTISDCNTRTRIIQMNPEVISAIENQIAESMSRWPKMGLQPRQGSYNAERFCEENENNLSLEKPNNETPFFDTRVVPPQAPPNTPKSPTNTTNTFTFNQMELKTGVQKLMAEYDDVFDIKNLKSLKGPKMRIILRDDVEVIPNYVNGSRAITLLK